MTVTTRQLGSAACEVFVDGELAGKCWRAPSDHGWRLQPGPEARVYVHRSGAIDAGMRRLGRGLTFGARAGGGLAPVCSTCPSGPHLGCCAPTAAR